MPRTKFNARKVRLDGYVFDYIDESHRYLELKMLQQLGKISSLEVHPKWPIEINGIRVCFVELDFKYLDSHEDWRHEDVKGADTAMFRLKRRMLEAAYPDITVELIRMRRRRARR